MSIRPSTSSQRAAPSAVAALLLVASGCKERDRSRAPSELTRLAVRVQGYCHQLTFDLERAADEYMKIAPRLDEMPDGQRQRAEAWLRWYSIGAGEDVRRQKLTDVQQRLHFCITARRLDTKQITAFEVRVDRLIEELGPDLVTGQLPPHETAGRAF